MRLFGFNLSLLFTAVLLSACERIPEWERNASQHRSVGDNQRRAELQKWLYVCRANQSEHSLNRPVEKFLDYFREKELSALNSRPEKTTFASGFLWDSTGILIVGHEMKENLKDIECASTAQSWTTVQILGVDPDIDLVVMKLAKSPFKASRNPWLQREERPSLDENISLISSFSVGQIDRLSVQLQNDKPTLGTGLDSSMILFLPPPPAFLAQSFLVDSGFRLLGMGLSTKSEVWGAAVTKERLQISVAEILSSGVVRRPYLGFRLSSFANGGFQIQEIQVGSPAYQAGLRVSDKLLEWDSQVLTEWEDPRSSDIGKKIFFKYERMGKVNESSLIVGHRD